MNISDAIFEMELNGVDAKDIDSIVELCRDKGFNSELLDEELLKRGYPIIFNINYEEYDDFDDDYLTIEKFPYKNQYRD
ncbi:2-carboxy-1,4-naphthoquinone phytyltransferase [Sulfurimonas hongkongensis]|nr:2-carboxy-1,4-naphthoquinone phytyltransferase [Sulfurimonas hongkongensis]